MSDPPRSRTVCVLPWIHLSTSVDGVWSRCCFDRTNDYDYLYESSERPLFELADDALGCVPRSEFARDNPDRAFGLREAFNSPAMRETRRQMLAGERPKACGFCWQREDEGTQSHRQAMNRRFARDVGLGELLAQTRADGHLPAPPVYLDLRFGNTCNLACVMCAHPISSRFAAAGHPDWVTAKIDPYSDDAALWRELGELASELRYVYFAGGEPFLQRGHFRFLDLLTSSGAAGHVRLHYNSNLTVLPRDLFERLAPFEHVTIAASCDGVGPVFERIRVHGRWEVFARNVRVAKDRVELWLDATVQRDNVLGLRDLVGYARDEGVRLRLENLVHFPEELCVRNVDDATKERARAELADLIAAEHAEPSAPSLARELAGVLAVLELPRTAAAETPRSVACA